MEFSPCKRAEQKRSNDRPAGYCRGSDSGKIKEIHQAHPRYASPDKNCQEYAKSEIVYALKANNLGNNEPRVPYNRTIEHDYSTSSRHPKPPANSPSQKTNSSPQNLKLNPQILAIIKHTSIIPTNSY
jgi:hypothetical protein